MCIRDSWCTGLELKHWLLFDHIDVLDWRWNIDCCLITLMYWTGAETLTAVWSRWCPELELKHRLLFDRVHVLDWSYVLHWSWNIDCCLITLMPWSGAETSTAVWSPRYTRLEMKHRLQFDHLDILDWSWNIDCSLITLKYWSGKKHRPQFDVVDVLDWSWNIDCNLISFMY